MYKFNGCNYSFLDKPRQPYFTTTVLHQSSTYTCFRGIRLTKDRNRIYLDPSAITRFSVVNDSRRSGVLSTVRNTASSRLSLVQHSSDPEDLSVCKNRFPSHVKNGTFMLGFSKIPSWKIFKVQQSNSML